jgi:hypothetical protein
MPVRKNLAHFPPRVTATLGNIDSRNLTCAVALATLDRWNIPHVHGVAHLTRAEVRNLRKAWFGSKGVRVRAAGKGTMLFELFDGFLRLDFDEPQTWSASKVRLTVSGVGR